MNAGLRISVVVSTYNQPAWLEKCLWSLLGQSHGGFEVIVADDGSRGETRDLVERMKPAFGSRLNHAWHADEGFRKNIILNEAVRRASGDYLVFIDGDIVARQDFVAAHARLARRDYFVSAGCFRLTLEVSRALSRADIEDGRAFSPRWLMRQGQPLDAKFLKLLPAGSATRALDFLTPTRRTFNGMNAAVFRSDFVRVNGFDERMAYGGCDREFGERLNNVGVRGQQCRYTLCCLHLEHGRPYVRRDLYRQNDAIREAVRTRKLGWTDYGLEAGPVSTGSSLSPPHSVHEPS